VFYVCFAILLTAYGLMRIMIPYNLSTTAIGCLAGLFMLCCVLREMFQMMYDWRLYVGSVENWLEFVVIGLTISLLVGHDSTGTWVNHVVAWLMLSTWLEMTLLIGRFPSIGIYIYMFVRVAQKLIKFLLVYSPLLFAFAITFRVIFGKIKTFKTIPLAVIKTFVMMMGEYDYDGLFTGEDVMSYPGTSHLVMILFVVCMSIITVNLLIGLTVNDIQGLFKTAGVQRLRMTVIQILYIESVVYSDVMLIMMRKNICERVQNKLTLLPKLMLERVDKHRHSESSPIKNGEGTPMQQMPKECTDEDIAPGRILRAGFLPNKSGRPHLYRTNSAGGLQPTRYVMHKWMLKNMLRILRERVAAEDRQTREQLLQDEILAAVRAKTDPLPFRLGLPTTPAAADSSRQPDGAAEGGTGRRTRRKEGLAGRDTLEEVSQKLNTVLAAVSEVSLKMGIMERRLNLMDPPRLDTFYSA